MIKGDNEQHLVDAHDRRLNDNSALLASPDPRHETCHKNDEDDKCWICLSASRPEDLFQPCHCNSFVHRTCLRQWRYTGNNLRAYTHCPNCAYQYRVTTVSINESQLHHTRSLYYHEIAKFWLFLLFLVGGTIAAFAGFSYLVDRSHKNVPVGMKYALTSIAYGHPKGGNATAVWEEEFKRPNVSVWPYYTLLGVVCLSILVLTVPGCVGLDDREYSQTVGAKDRTPVYSYRHRGRGYCCRETQCLYINCNACYCDCDVCWCCAEPLNLRGLTPAHCMRDCCGTVAMSNDGSCCCCGDCDLKNHHSDSCDGDAGSALLVIALVVLVFIIAVVVISAVWVIIVVTTKRLSSMHQAYSARLYACSQERSGETRVLGRDEMDAPSCHRWV
eukprot:PhM_4_TR1429/c0_g1_i2/m.66708